jgi:hypothetical protein
MVALNCLGVTFNLNIGGSLDRLDRPITPNKMDGILRTLVRLELPVRPRRAALCSLASGRSLATI